MKSSLRLTSLMFFSIVTCDNCFVTPTGNTRLPFPILQEDLDRYNILKVRPLTCEEMEEVCKEFDLT